MCIHNTHTHTHTLAIHVTIFFSLTQGMEYMPGAASMTATHKKKVKNLWLAEKKHSAYHHMQAFQSSEGYEAV